MIALRAARVAEHRLAVRPVHVLAEQEPSAARPPPAAFGTPPLQPRTRFRAGLGQRPRRGTPTAPFRPPGYHPSRKGPERPFRAPPQGRKAPFTSWSPLPGARG